MKYKDLVERVAITMHQFENGLTHDDFKELTGRDRPAWKKQYDFQKEELAEHERDEYRVQAYAVVDRLLSLGVIDIKTHGKGDEDVS